MVDTITYQNIDLSPESPCILPYYYTPQNNDLPSWTTLFITLLLYSPKQRSFVLSHPVYYPIILPKIMTFPPESRCILPYYYTVLPKIMTFHPESLCILPYYYTPKIMTFPLNHPVYYLIIMLPKIMTFPPEPLCILPYYYTPQNNYLSSWITLYITLLLYSTTQNNGLSSWTTLYMTLLLYSRK